MHTFSIGKDSFLLDGAPFRVLSGAIHYFRVPREYWRDRLEKLRACGFNTVETYVAWNAHMPDENTFLFDDMLDLSAFLKLAQELGLWAIVRPGPYICAEWEFGALPWWLLKEDIPLRCADPAYMKHVEAFFDQLLPRIRENLVTNGGNVIMMQVENEYGSYGDDDEYLRLIRSALRARGVDVELFTSDGATDFMLTGGTLPDVHKTVNFGSRASEQFQKLRERQKTGPLMCAEFWNGWFDHWGETHHTREPEVAAACLKEILDAGASVSVYMFHGGTNFGFMNGANCPGRFDYQPTVSSYDDDALLNECGDVTPKYVEIQKLLASDAPLPKPCEKADYGKVVFTRSQNLLSARDLLGTRVHTAAPAPMEKFGQGYGFTLYSTFVRGPREENSLFIQEVRDRAHVFANGNFVGTVYRNDETPAVRLSVPAEGLRLDILVENMGRVNYGPYMRDPKGITEGVRLGQQFLFGWDIWPMEMKDVSALPFEEGVRPFSGTPVFLSGDFNAGEKPKDTFVKLPGFKKGVIFINGKPLSRHWEIGPQKSAYLPAPFMKPGKNTLTVLELDGFTEPAAYLDAKMDIG